MASDRVIDIKDLSTSKTLNFTGFNLSMSIMDQASKLVEFNTDGIEKWARVYTISKFSGEPVTKVCDWIKDNCVSRVVNNITVDHDGNYHIITRFEDHSEAIMFRLVGILDNTATGD